MKTRVLNVEESKLDAFLGALQNLGDGSMADQEKGLDEKTLIKKRLKNLKAGTKAVFLWEEVKDMAFSKP